MQVFKFKLSLTRNTCPQAWEGTGHPTAWEKAKLSILYPPSVLWHQEGHPACKNFAQKPLAIAVDISGWGTGCSVLQQTQLPVNTTDGETGLSVFTYKMAVKMVRACICINLVSVNSEYKSAIPRKVLILKLEKDAQGKCCPVWSIGLRAYL